MRLVGLDCRTGINPRQRLGYTLGPNEVAARYIRLDPGNRSKKQKQQQQQQVLTPVMPVGLKCGLCDLE